MSEDTTADEKDLLEDESADGEDDDDEGSVDVQESELKSGMV